MRAMKRTVYLAMAAVLISIGVLGAFLSTTAYSTTDQYAVGGEIIPVNPAPYLLNPALLAAIVALVAFLAALITIKGSPIRIEIERI